MQKCSRTITYMNVIIVGGYGEHNKGLEATCRGMSLPATNNI